LQAHTAAYSIAIDIADKIGRGESSPNGKSVEADPTALKRKWLRRNRITTLLDPFPTKISCNQPRYSAKRHYILHITARFPGYHR
jgi:hypothetical protein